MPLFGAAVAAQGTIGSVISPPFKVYLLVAPGGWYAFRDQLVQMIANNLEDLGIQVETVMTYEWDTVDGRVLYPPSGLIGKTYVEGGFDVLFIDWLLDPDPSVYFWSHSSQFPPAGGNYYLWNNTMADMLAYNITTIMDSATQLQCIKLWQQVAYEELPSIALYYEYGVVAFRPNFNSTPFVLYYYPNWPGVEWWSFISSPLTSVTLALPYSCPYAGLSPYHSTYYSDSIGYGSIFGELHSYGLLMRGLNRTSMEPYMAYENHTMSPDGRNWTFWIRPGIMFHNGEELDARDVVYTFRYAMTPSWNSVSYPYIKEILGSNASVYWAGEVGTAGAGMSYNKYEVHFDIPKTWAFFEQDIGGATILPSSVLVNSTGGIPDFSAWHPDSVKTAGFASTSFVTGSNLSYGYIGKNGMQYIASGPIGAGPYKWNSFNPTTLLLHLKKFDGYFNKATLESGGAFGVTDFYVKCIPDTNEAISCLKNNSVQVLDSHYHPGKFLSALSPAWSQIASFQAYKGAEMGFNMRHPIWGTGLGTPLGQQDPNQAAEAAKHVRHAFDYLMPKDNMISSLLNGYGAPGLTSPITRSMLGFNNDISLRNGSAPNAKTLAMNELAAAGYTFVEPSRIDLEGILLSPIVLAVLASTAFILGVGVIRRRRRMNYLSTSRAAPRKREDTEEAVTRTPKASVRRPRLIAPAVGSVSLPALITCSKCGKASKQPGGRYCMYCGAPLEGGSKGEEISAGDRRTALPTGKCMVCELEVQASDPVVFCPYCRNPAHRAHMLEWLHVKDYCPICRRHLDEEDLVKE